MSDSARFALLRPEILSALVRGDNKIVALMNGSSRSLGAGTTLIEADTDHPFVYRMIDGWGCRTRTLADGRVQCILIFLPGDLFAVKSMFITRHPDAVRVLSQSVVERLDYRELHRAYVEDSDVSSRCLWQVMEEERRLHTWVVGLGQGSAEERLALLLVDFHGRLALCGHIAPDASAYEMPLTQCQLAEHLGVTAVHMNRVLRVLREDGVVTIRHGSVLISNMAELARRAHPLLDTSERSQPAYVGSKSEGSDAGRPASDLSAR